MREKDQNKRRKAQSFYTGSLSNPKPELYFHYASRILISNHKQSIIPTPKKETKAPNTRVLCEYKPKRTLLLAQTRKP